MNFFDRFIDAFSMKDLAKRVNGVIAFGMAIIVIASIGGYLFLTSNFTSSIDCVVTKDGAIMDDRGDIAIEVSIDHDDLERLPEDGKLKIDISSIDPKLKPQNITIESINPTTGVLKITFAEENVFVPIKKGAEGKLIIADTPLWKLLLKK